jgi:hypothetical protein
MSALTLDQVNAVLYNAAQHLIEAGKHLSSVDEFAPYGKELFDKALILTNLINASEPKMTNERSDEILNEILNLGEDNGNGS